MLLCLSNNPCFDYFGHQFPPGPWFHVDITDADPKKWNGHETMPVLQDEATIEYE